MDYNPIYSAYCEIILKGKNPNKLTDIPFLPISFFKEEQIICQGQKIEEIFLSSGTTGNQSKHLVSDLSIYRAFILLDWKSPQLDIEEISLYFPCPGNQTSRSYVFFDPKPVYPEHKSMFLYGICKFFSIF